ncbi:unnamed protein product [Linum trigynum]|uniref:Uncharacterized protein n=1 Tax=Linum trigynum TaxID=586398 RepID=A0AAV2DMW8_9ROSI
MVMMATTILGGAMLAGQRDQIIRGTTFKHYMAGVVGLEDGTGLGLGQVPWLYGPKALMLPTRVVGVTLAMVGQSLGSTCQG